MAGRAAEAVQFTGLAQNLGQLQASNGDSQSKCWANLRISNQPCESQAEAPGGAEGAEALAAIARQLASILARASLPHMVDKVGLGRFVPPPVHSTPESVTYSVPLFLKRQCDRTLRQGPRDAGGVPRPRGGARSPAGSGYLWAAAGSPVARKVLGWPKMSKLVHAFRWEYCYERLKLAQLLDQLGVVLTFRAGSVVGSTRRQSSPWVSIPSLVRVPSAPTVVVTQLFLVSVS